MALTARTIYAGQCFTQSQHPLSPFYSITSYRSFKESKPVLNKLSLIYYSTFASHFSTKLANSFGTTLLINFTSSFSELFMPTISWLSLNINY